MSNIRFAGANGAGKSTTLNMLPGSQKPSQGRVTIDGMDASIYKTKREKTLDILRKM